MEYGFLKIEHQGAITIMKVSAPKSLNALNSTILGEMRHFVENLDTEATRVLIITGDGDKSFVAGADISEMAHLNEQEGYEFGYSNGDVKQFKVETADPDIKIKSYAWKYSTDGEKWTDCANGKKNTLSMTMHFHPNVYIKCVVTIDGTTVESNRIKGINTDK